MRGALLAQASDCCSLGFADPAAMDAGDAAMLDAFRQVEMGLRNRIEPLMDLPISK